MPGIRTLGKGATKGVPDRTRRRTVPSHPPTTMSTDCKENNDHGITSADRSPPMSLRPVKIKVEYVDDDDDDNDVDSNGNHSGDGGLLSVPSKTKREKRVAEIAGVHEGKVIQRTSESVDEDGDELHSMSVDQEDAASEDFNHHGRYSPFDGMGENSESDDFVPIQDQEGNVMLEVDCGANGALLYVNKLCQGSKGQCIFFEDRWYTPNEFQFISGRETAKDWKRSIRHRGKSLKMLMGRGLLRAHPLMCECETCRLNFASKGGLRFGDRRVAAQSSSCNANGSLTAAERARLRRSNGSDGEGGHLSDIIDQLQHGSSSNNGYSNGHPHHAYEGSRDRKRALGADNPSPSNSKTVSSMAAATCGLALVKRPRSISPREDDIYDEQQRKIFEAANSPEPQNIENLRRSLNLGTSRSNSPLSGSGSPAHQTFGSNRNTPTVMVTASVNGIPSPANMNVPADLSRRGSTSPPSGAAVGSSGLVLVSQAPQMMLKHQSKSRKQTAPQHLDVGSNREEAHTQRSAQIILSSYSGQPYNKANAAIRPRYQSPPVYNHRGSSSSNGSSTVHHLTGSSGELNLSTNGNSSSSRRSQSHVTPAMRAAGNIVKMIELTRPEITPSASSGYSSGSRPSSTQSSHNPGEDGSAHAPGHPSIGNSDTAFLPADITAWSVSDVTHFVQSLKGCEEYGPVFREQAIDGEILPVLTEDHLLHNMGLKLGPALKIRLHVARRLGFTLDGQYCSVAAPPPPPSSQQPPAATQQAQQQQQQPTPATVPPPSSTTPVPAGARPVTPASSQKSNGDTSMDDDDH